jgi:Raf kinase inhibitor-like YbhB/YbcL family protein
MRQVDVEDRLDRRAAIAPTLVLLFVTIAACTTGGGASGSTAAAATSASAGSTASQASSTAPSSQPEDSVMAPSPSPSTTATFVLTSPAFADGQPIPREYTCKGQDVSPELAWDGVPAGTAALVLLVDDPDGRDWVHWSVLDLSADERRLPKGVDPLADRPQQGQNDFRKVGYGGPCPPSGTHHYRFTLYALAAPLGLSGHPGGDDVRAALGRATVVGQVRLTGTFAA